MATRTVSVLLTGVVTPYVSAMRTAARSTTTTARGIEADMRRVAVSSQAAMSSIARAAQTSAVRASVSLSSVGTRGVAAMSSLGTRGVAAMSSITTAAGLTAANLSARFPAAVARVNTTLSALGVRGTAAFTTMSTAAAAAAAAISARWTAMSTAVSARWTAVSAAVSRAMAAASMSAASAASWVSARWTAAAATVAGAFSSMRLAAYAAGASMMGMATGAPKALKGIQTASLGLIAVFGLAAFAAARFEKAMSEVRAVTGGSAKDMKSLSKAALDAGQATIYSATQAANAEAELARAGISTADIIGGALKGALDLAASGQLELGESAIISAQAMNAFKLTGRDVGHIADVISAGAGKSATNVHDMGMAFRQAALLSSQTGLSLEQTVGSLSLFAQNALTGSDAGTSLKVMLQRLVPQSNEARAAMEAIGFSAYDASGNFIGLSALAGVMKSSFSQLTPEARNAAMATIFGSDAVRAATILYEAGADGVDKWVSAVDDAGYAVRVASTMTDNLAGDLERLKGAFETALISSGSSANSALREMAQAVTSLVNWYNNLSPAVQSNVTIMAGLAGVVGFLGTGLLLMLPRIMAVRAELIALGVTAARTRAAFAGFTAVGGVVAGLAAISWGIGELKKRMDDAPPSADKMTNSLVHFTKTGKASGELAKVFGGDLMKLKEAMRQVGDPSFTDQMAHIHESLRLLNERGRGTGLDESRMLLREAQDGLKAIDQALANLAQSSSAKDAEAAFQQIATQVGLTGDETEKLKELLPSYTDALASADTQTQLGAKSQAGLQDAISMTNDQIQDQRTEAEKLKDALSALNGVAISAAEKEISFRASIADLTEAVKENGHSLDVTTEKGRAVKGAFLDAAQAAMAHAQAVTEQSGTIEAGNAILEQDIAVLKRQMLAAGFSTAAVEQLIGAYAKMPTQVVTDIKAETAKAVADLQNVQAELRNTKGKSVTIDALTAQAEQNLKALGFSVTRLPDGRVTVHIPTGPPSAAIDAIQGRINNITGRTVGVGVYLRATSWDQDANGVPDLIQSRRDGGLVGYAGGGAVRGYPTGGAVRGPGSGTSDSILARISNGEYVIRAASVRQYGLAMLDQLNAGRLTTAGYNARPATQYGVSHGPTQVTNNKTNNVTLNGAGQSTAEQLAEITRRLAFIS
ncbi:phage tail tape measure protein [Streptomyces virginiae]|uniref:phage tail tape measure protein n=1 Tax=Streptomyces virginiae TaxID=1961 RepID=UPI0036611992